MSQSTELDVRFRYERLKVANLKFPKSNSSNPHTTQINTDAARLTQGIKVMLIEYRVYSYYWQDPMPMCLISPPASRNKRNVLSSSSLSLHSTRFLTDVSKPYYLNLPIHPGRNGIRRPHPNIQHILTSILKPTSRQRGLLPRQVLPLLTHLMERHNDTTPLKLLFYLTDPGIPPPATPLSKPFRSLELAHIRSEHLTAPHV